MLLTQVHVLRSGPLGERQVLIKGLQDFLLHLADRVRVHDPDGQRVHAAALEGHVDVLRDKKKKKRRRRSRNFRKNVIEKREVDIAATREKEKGRRSECA